MRAQAGRKITSRARPLCLMASILIGACVNTANPEGGNMAGTDMSTTHIDMQNAPSALLSQTSPEITANITAALSRALGGRKVAISADAFTQDSTIIIQPKHVMDRDMRRPDQFTLKMANGTCGLMHDGTGNFYPLSAPCKQAFVK